MAAPISVYLLRDTLDLVRLYHTSSTFKTSFDRLFNNPRVIYLGRPLKDYVYLITKVTPEYKGVLAQGLTQKHVSDLFNDFYFNKHGYPVLAKEYVALNSGQIGQPSFLTKDEHNEVVKSEGEKIKKDESLKRKIEGPATTKPVITPTPATEKIDRLRETGAKGIKPIKGVIRGSVLSNKLLQEEFRAHVPYLADKVAKDSITSGSIGIRKIIARNPRGTITVLSSGVSFIVTYLATGGNVAMATMAGIGGGAAANYAAANSESRGSKISLPYNPVTNRLRQGTRSVASNLAKRAGSAVARRVFLGIAMNPITFWVIVGILAFIGIIILIILLQQTSLFPPYQDKQAVNFCQQTTSVAGSCPTQEAIDQNKKSPLTCNGLNVAVDIYNTALPEDRIKQYIESYSKVSGLNVSEFESRTRLIVKKAQQVGLNPVIYLGLWKSESGFKGNLGCAPGKELDFESEVNCAVGLNGSGEFQKDKGSEASKCAQNVNLEIKKNACDTINQIVTANPGKYPPEYRPKVPITTLDDFDKFYGQFSPYLGDAPINNNCVHSYNTHVEVAKELGACNATATLAIAQGQINSCKFYRNDQTSSSENCPPSDQGFRCEAGLTYKSALLLSYINEIAAKVGIPAPVLAGLVRVESTVPKQYSATGKSYSISDYSDEDVKAMVEFSSQVDFSTLDQTVGSSNKALCPRSLTGALGITQIQPPVDFINKMEAQGLLSKENATTGRGAHKDGASVVGKADGAQTLADYCNPKTSLEMAAKFILYLKGGKWNPPTDTSGYKSYIDSLAKSYYGQDSQTSSYGASLWDSVSSCQAAPSSLIAQNNVSQAGSLSNGKVVVLDPGHCSNDKYGEKKVPENKLNIDQANKLASLLNANGFKTLVYNPNNDGSCKEEDYYQNLQARVDFANTNKADVFVSVHADSGVQDDTFNPIYSAKGPYSDESTKLGQLMGKGVVDVFKTRGKNISYNLSESTQTGTGQGGGKYYVLGPKGAPTAGLYGGKVSEITNSRNMPGIIMEDYLKTSIDYKDIFSYIDDISLGYCNGISQFLGFENCKNDTTLANQTTNNNVCPTPSTGGLVANGNFTYYCQGDPKWDDKSGCGTGQVGCGPTSMAMIFSYFGEIMNPADMFNLYQKEGLISCQQGSFPGKINAWLKTKGYEVGPNIAADNLDTELAKKYITDGYLIIGSSHGFIGQRGKPIDHIFVVQDVDPAARTFVLRDPENCSYATGEEFTKNNIQPITGGKVPSWSYAYPIKKII